jgi:hypothetical protein
MTKASLLLSFGLGAVGGTIFLFLSLLATR